MGDFADTNLWFRKYIATLCEIICSVASGPSDFCICDVIIGYGDVEVIKNVTEAISVIIALCVPVRKKKVVFHRTKQWQRQSKHWQ